METTLTVGRAVDCFDAHTGTDTITSFFEDETSGDPWLVIVEPD